MEAFMLSMIVKLRSHVIIVTSILLGLLAPLTLKAVEVFATQAEAQQAASNYIRDLESLKKDPTVTKSQTFTDENGVILYYFEFGSNGYALCPALKYLPPVLWANNTGTYDFSIPGKGVPGDILMFVGQATTICKDNNFDLNALGQLGWDQGGLSEAVTVWGYYANDYETYSHLIQAYESELDDIEPGQIGCDGIDWSQWEPFNHDCPSGDPCGCVATAMGIVMCYWEWPPQGDGGAPYSDAYDWDNIWQSTSACASHPEAVGELCHEAGLAVDMEYHHDGSSANVRDVDDALGGHFHFHANGENRWGWSHVVFPPRDSNDWYDYIKNSISRDGPVIYGIEDSDGIFGYSGHCIVLDGYRDTLGVHQWHVNYGWGSNGPDGWYTVTSIPGDDNVAWYNEAVLDIYPSNPDAYLPRRVRTSTITKTLQNSGITPNKVAIHLDWSSSVTRNHHVWEHITGYNVYYDDKVANQWVLLTHTTGTSFTFSGLTGDGLIKNGQTVSLKVSAVNSHGEGPLSESINTTLASPARVSSLDCDEPYLVGTRNFQMTSDGTQYVFYDDGDYLEFSFSTDDGATWYPPYHLEESGIATHPTILAYSSARITIAFNTSIGVSVGDFYLGNTSEFRYWSDIHYPDAFGFPTFGGGTAVRLVNLNGVEHLFVGGMDGIGGVYEATNQQAETWSDFHVIDATDDGVAVHGLDVACKLLHYIDCVQLTYTTDEGCFFVQGAPNSVGVMYWEPTRETVFTKEHGGTFYASISTPSIVVDPDDHPHIAFATYNIYQGSRYEIELAQRTSANNWDVQMIRSDYAGTDYISPKLCNIYDGSTGVDFILTYLVANSLYPHACAARYVTHSQDGWSTIYHTIVGGLDRGMVQSVENGDSPYLLYCSGGTSGEILACPVSGQAFKTTVPDQLPTEFSIVKNYPNPFNATTMIEFGLPEASDVTMSVFNVLGRRVFQGKTMNYSAGYHEMVLNGEALGAGTGLLIVKLHSDFGDQVRKVIYLK